MSNMSKPSKFISCNDNSSPRELWITEGDSAVGSIKSHRQGLFRHIYDLLFLKGYKEIWKTDSRYRFYGLFEKKYRLRRNSVLKLLSKGGLR